MIDGPPKRVSPGDPITAEGFNSLIGSLRRHKNFTEGVVNKDFTATRALPSISLIKVLVTEDVPAATWDGSRREWVPSKIEVRHLFTKEPELWTHTANDVFEVYFFYATAITITPSHARFGYVLNNELIIVDCEEVDIS